MVFENKPFEWNKSGAEPTESEKNLGLQGGMGLPAAFVNQQWYKTYLCIKEIQEKLAKENSENMIVTNSLVVGPTANQLWLGHCSSALGYELYHSDYLTSVGKYSKSPTEASLTTNTGDLFIVGSGLQGGAKSNAFRVTAAGDVMGTKAYAATGADIAHNMEWLDENPNNEDRRGLFVTTVGKKIRVANSSDDYILGVISATPSLICNANTDDWRGKYVTDEYGARVMRDGAYILSDEFDESLDDDYANCLERPEKANVGHSGIVIARDDGTCVVDGYCLPNDNGVATKAETGYRVLERLSENRIQIFVSAPLIINK